MSDFKSDMDKSAYAIGINMGEYVQQMAVKMDGAMVAAGLADYLAGKSKLDPKEYVYTGLEIKPKVEIEYSGEKLKENAKAVCRSLKEMSLLKLQNFKTANLKLIQIQKN